MTKCFYMKANTNARTLSDDRNAMWDVIIGAAFAIIFIVTALYIGTFVQATVGTATYNAVVPDGYGLDSDIANKTRNTLLNLSGYWDTNVGMLNIALVIVIITLPLMALVYVRKIM